MFFRRAGMGKTKNAALPPQKNYFVSNRFYFSYTALFFSRNYFNGQYLARMGFVAFYPHP